MTCKASPAVYVDRVVLHDKPFVTIQTLISGLDDTLLMEEHLRSFVKVVCVLSVYNPDGEDWRSSQWITSSPPNPTPADALDENIHWTYPDWHSGAAVKDYVIGVTGDTNKTDGDGNIKHDFTIDLTDLIVDPASEGLNDELYWQSTGYLKYFVYIQVDTQQLAEQYGITISNKYNGMSGEYSSGEIITGEWLYADHVDGTGREWINDYRDPSSSSNGGGCYK